LQEVKGRNEENRKLDAERWEKFSKKLTRQFKTEVNKLNGSMVQRVEQETGRLSHEISTLQAETQQEIELVNCVKK
jgi:archaellum component FlaC